MEYTGLSYVLREVVLIMQPLKNLMRAGYPIECTMSNFTCKVFEENSASLNMATVHNHIARTKHLNVKIHHLRDYVTRGEVIILPIGILYQASNRPTKAH